MAVGQIVRRRGFICTDTLSTFRPCAHPSAAGEDGEEEKEKKKSKVKLRKYKENLQGDLQCFLPAKSYISAGVDEREK
jgi:hypothetical protein